MLLSLELAADAEARGFVVGGLGDAVDVVLDLEILGLEGCLGG